MITTAGAKIFFIAVLVGALIACDQSDEQKGQSQVEQESPGQAGAEAALSDLIARHRQRVLNIPDVVGMGIGKCARDPNELCVLVYVKTDEWPTELSRRLDGYEVELRKTGGDLRPLR